mmetsp:Transcript_48768/g.125711  ORF Transcript_48768/g.125711 Transcript_48768/m.125711 type:complete len:359 (-) Transcript_48768:538-1614(-)
MVHATLQEATEVGQASGHDGIANHHWEGAVLRRPHGAELEAVAAEGERRRAVPVLNVGLHRHGSRATSALQLLIGLEAFEGRPTNDSLDMRLEACARIQRDDGRRRLLSAEAVVVARMCHCAPHHLVVLAETIGQARDTCDEQLLCLVILARVEEVHAGVGANRPVAVLSAAIDASEGLLVKEHLEPCLGRFPVCKLHEEDVAVAGVAGAGVDGAHLVLSRCHLVVPHGHRAAHLQHLGLDVAHELIDTKRHWAKVVEVSLLVAGRKCAHECTPAVQQVWALLVVVRRDHKELLLPAEIATDRLGMHVEARQLQEAKGMRIHSVVGAEERSLVIDALAIVRDERARDVERRARHEGWR